MRKAYKSRRNAVVSMLLASPFADRIQILEQDAGLHFLVKVDTELSDEALEAAVQRMGSAARFAENTSVAYVHAGIRVQTLSSYYHGTIPAEDRNCLVINYSGLHPEQIEALSQKLKEL